MRQFLIFLIIPTLLVLGILELDQINRTFKTMHVMVSACQVDITNVQKAQELNSYWQKREKQLGYLSKHGSLNEISIRSLELKTLIEQGDLEKAALTANLLYYLVETAYRNIGFSLHNII